MPAFAPVHVPLAPQFELLVIGLVQVPSQLTSVPGQVRPHLPALQTNPAAHAVPAFGATQLPLAPQLELLVAGSMQVPPQSTSVPGQTTPQVPALQTSPAGQAVPAVVPVHAPLAPQFELLVCGLMQVPPQLTSVPRQETPHVPPLQTSPAGHTAPTVIPVQAPLAPQLELLVSGSMQVPPQLTSVPGHEMPHTLPLQTWPAGHTLPQVAQLSRSLVVLTQRFVPPSVLPASAEAVQRVNGLAQVVPQ